MDKKIEKYCNACVIEKRVEQVIRENHKGRKIYFFGKETGQSPPSLLFFGESVSLDANFQKSVENAYLIFFNLDVENFLQIKWIDDFEPINDFLIIKRHPRRVPIGDYREKEFTDSYMNKVQGVVTEDIVIYLRGSSSKVILNDYEKIGSLKIHVDDFSNIVFKDAIFIYDLEMFVDRGCNVIFGNNCIIRNNSIIFCRDQSSIEVGEKTTFGRNLTIASHNNIKIGKDCLISNDCIFQCGDGHSIFDVCTGLLCNDTRVKNEKNSIDVGDHTWIGLRSTILNGTKVGAGSIVACGAIVKGQFFNNCMIGGVPAKVLKNNIAWCHQKNASNISSCGKYVKRTELL